MDISTSEQCPLHIDIIDSINLTNFKFKIRMLKSVFLQQRQKKLSRTVLELFSTILEMQESMS